MKRYTNYICLLITVLAIQACSNPNVNNDESGNEEVKEVATEVISEEVVEVDNTVWSNLEELPDRPSELTPETSGYYKERNANGDIKTLYPYCKGVMNGVAMMFHPNGALDGYAEFANGELVRSIDLTDLGILVNFFDGKERVISEVKLQNISGEMKEKLDYVRTKCARVDQVDQNIILSHNCDNLN